VRPRSADARSQGKRARPHQRHAGMTAIGVLAGLEGRAGLAQVADISAALTIEAILGNRPCVRPQGGGPPPAPGSAGVGSENLMRLLAGSEILSSHRKKRTTSSRTRIRSGALPRSTGVPRRGSPQRGDPRDRAGLGLRQSRRVVETGEILSGGNFHGQPVALCLRALAAATVGLASISERRLFRLLDPKNLSNGLPAFLVGEAGVNSGFMVCQYTAASLVSGDEEPGAPGGRRLDHVLGARRTTSAWA